MMIEKNLKEKTDNKITEDIKEIKDYIRYKRPLVHCITNMVTANDCANVIHALGASPIMAMHPFEVQEITANANALVLNMGAIGNYEAMEISVKEASKYNLPIVVDPVGAAASSYRREKCLELLSTSKNLCIRGNYAEIIALIDNKNTAKGLDCSIDYSKNKSDKVYDSFAGIEDISNFARKNEAIIVITGKKDIITDGKDVLFCNSGHEMMSRITGAGCMLSCLIASCLAIVGDIKNADNSSFDKLYLAKLACQIIGDAGMQAAAWAGENGLGTMSFKNKLIDKISL